MANTIDYTYFQAEPLYIAGIGQTNNVTENAVTAFITKYEPMLLNKVFGVSFYQLYLAGVQASTQKYLDILNGVTYTDVSGQSYYWPGLKSSNNSIISFYVFYYYQRMNATKSGVIGENMPQSDISVRTSPMEKATAAWNEMVRLLAGNYNTPDRIETGYLWHMLQFRYASGAQVYTDFDMSLININSFKPINAYGI